MRRLGAPILALLVFLLMATGCREKTPPEPPPTPTPTPTPEPTPTPPVTEPAQALRRVDGASLGLDDGELDSLRTAVRESLVWLSATPDRELVFGPRTVTADLVHDGLERFLELLADDPGPDELRRRVREHFEIYESVAGDEVLVTGYYEPMIDASLTRRRGYEVPIYGPPEDRVVIDLTPFAESLAGKKIVARVDGRSVVPYWDRSEIRRGRLRGRGFEIGWARDPIDLFFVEVQGSGTLRLPDGGERRIGYAGANGREYRSIGKLLIDEGLVDRSKMSMQAIRAYLEANPDDVTRVLDYNTSTVFFRFLEGGALGSLGRPVTAGRSVATDKSLFPKGALAFLDTRLSEQGADGDVVPGEPLRRFVLNQDTGGAIRGPDRVDLFFGRGAEASDAAGRMQSRGKIYFLCPK